MGVCQSQKNSSQLKRSGAQQFIFIDFDKLKKYNEERQNLDKNNGQQQSFCQIICLDNNNNNKSSNPQTQTYNNVQTQQIEIKKE
ncbi:unnamed protein product (macronuclear) [Paramecium tetraurelia]|uniref:Uncharacterized protein n=1 Tax=Paramecium tetraurelia TaxID=5888 RepID=A0DZ95_PARTE|nr:uncharacterized protein GSPATT00003331001 [Paramecium tetraurelia]CAK88362.1 unnamed protein product [Paramecium tetraurelia]|eukprot:XP_001455759.1 hypothetical protein (macronuclear) [Paramecium tetraurelia strain d4-2]